ncbi:MAG: GDSL-type esterase/lipase family protein [Planctomycetota bacterium]
MRRHLIPLLIIACLAGAAPGEPLPTRIEPGADKIQLLGAWTEDFRAAWTGTGLRFRTDATAANLLMRDHAPGGAHPNKGNRNNYLAIQIDDGEPAVLSLERGVERYPIAGLDGRPHTVTVFKRTEPLFGPITFKGLELPAGAALLDPPPPAKVRMQVIGDSISAGYGNEAGGPKVSFKHCEENGWMTYWAIAARRLGTDGRCAAWSGLGVYRDRKGNTTGQLPDLWRLALPGKETAPERDGAAWRPTLVVINLGTNDIARGIPDAKAFTDAYRRLIADVRTTSPDATIYCVFGPMITPTQHGAIRTCLETIAADDDRIHVVDLTNPHGLDGAGSHWHPNVRAHTTMAGQLLEAIRATQAAGPAPATAPTP